MAMALRGRLADRNLACGIHQGQRPATQAARTGRTHDGTDGPPRSLQKALAMQAPPTHVIA